VGKGQVANHEGAWDAGAKGLILGSEKASGRDGEYYRKKEGENIARSPERGTSEWSLQKDESSALALEGAG